ncbi:DegV domain-containing protein [Clostridium acetireducens DSM 10703]|jgi:DegV family protein with EDD domain|uniref:DegV domain-containing protein n=1 Tax=Clostridium acetireducens DSM 10703 TaxID=1121290 RepID=A0A1E8F0N9_9CLOT|nr:DegV family protein [Clostridium acetireducens]OFI07011.1 DegV domain-containing protein [Clostridium acetireducens DSM 10703]
MNKEFEIITDSCCDLPAGLIIEKNIHYVSLTCSYLNMEYKDDFGISLSSKQLFEDMRKGIIPKTSQPNSNDFYLKFKEFAKQGKDILYIGVSSGLSGTINSANIAKNMIKEEFPDVLIYIVDILTASLGQGIMVMKAYDMKENGYSMGEIVDYLEINKQKLNTYITVNDLEYLKKGGRISSTAAILGMVLHIKPILTLDKEGKVIPVIKIKGRKKVINKIAAIVKEKIENPEEQIIGICHGDCIEEALKLKEAILKNIDVKDVILNYIGPVVGVYGGPGALAVFFIGKDRQNHIID